MHLDKGDKTLRYFYHFDIVDTLPLSILIFDIDLYLKCHQLGPYNGNQVN